MKLFILLDSNDKVIEVVDPYISHKVSDDGKTVKVKNQWFEYEYSLEKGERIEIRQVG